MTVLLETSKICKSYGSFVALHDVSIKVSTGEFISIVGPNGAGKTTLVNVLTGLHNPTSGNVRFKGTDISNLGPVKLAKLGMARAFQLVHVFPALTVRETIAAAAIAQLEKSWNMWRPALSFFDVEERVKAIADIFGLRRKLDTISGHLSQGDKKLLDVASAFALKPEVILLDEPTSGVSSADKHVIMRTLIAAAREAGVGGLIQVEHDMDLVSEYSDRVVAIFGGRVLADKPPSDFFADAHLIATVVGKRRGH
ncbi:ABC transporter ATP-binding protein [Bradyrhizobium ottawaense]|uniref:ABC transporter ATP-binding protein n=1 Tax=Bradyrhizobium ottawaense TaxID=931866 RepID=UPI0004830C6D|nr:ABC transporter ATP-binding protein [Bradyrhizobium ottawaense]